MNDHLDHAAEVLWASVDDKGIRGRLFREDCDYLARALDEAGLLASPERDAEVERLRTGIEKLTRRVYDHTPDCVRARESAWLLWHPDCGRCWQDVLHALLNPTEGETDE